MSNFWMRTITGFSMVFLIIFVMYLSQWAFSALFLIVTILGLLEFYYLTSTETVSPLKIFGVIAGIVLFISLTLTFLEPSVSNYRIQLTMFPAVFLFAAIIFEIFRKQSNPIVNLAVTFFGITYIALPLALLTILSRNNVNHDLFGMPSVLFAYFLLTWIYDTGAYLAGKNFGRHKFFERISPKKTWEGIIGGFIVASVLTAGLIFLVPAIAWYHWIFLELIIVFFGTMGDLAESMFKRSLSVKDSGSILPGHGGILDRFDSVFLSAPFVFLYFIFFLSGIA